MKNVTALVLACLLALWTAGGDARETETGMESFLVITDTHLTRDPLEHAAMMEAVLQAARGRDAVLLLGDNTNNTHAEEHALVLQWARDIEEKAGARVFILPGNHDLGVHMGAEDFREQYLAYGWNRAFSQDTASASYAVMTAGGTCLLLLDTNQFAQDHTIHQDGGIGADTLKWAQEVLRALPDGTPVLACGHHPLLPAARNERTPGALAMSQVLRAYGVGLYLCGHDHGFATVEQDALRQVTVGQPQAYPGWAGVVERAEDGFLWRTEPLYDPQSPILAAQREGALDLGRRMAQGSLEPTPYAEDAEAIEWFAGAFMQYAGHEMTPEGNAALLADENCEKWRQAETRTVVKQWMLALLENCPEEVRRIFVPLSRKHPMRLPP